MEITAQVVREKDGPFISEKLILAEPHADELVVRIVATGMCHSDLDIVHQHFPLPLPFLLGHEGAGVVERVGSRITHVVPGDHVVLSFDSCGSCRACTSGHCSYCENWFKLNATGRRSDGSATVEKLAEGAINASFFGQSSFATYAIARARNTVKVPKDLPIELLGPFGCGFQTGAGTVLNVMKPAQGSSFALFGAGAVGLAALMAAKISGCTTIVAVDRDRSRLSLAKELGATHVIDASHIDPLEPITSMGGVDFSVEATGSLKVAEVAVRALAPQGLCVLLSTPSPGATMLLPLDFLAQGRRVMGVVEGDADPQTFIPTMLEHYRAGRFPIDKLVKLYEAHGINQARADSESGVSIKPIIRMNIAK